MKVVDQVTFLPESLNGRARERDWLWNMGDWMISKKRYWGLALPIWVDEKTGEFEVIGSREELKERAVEGWDGVRRPHAAPAVRGQGEDPEPEDRQPDVAHPGRRQPVARRRHRGRSARWATTRDRDYWEKWYPADFITESFPGQFRNWFYALLAMSTMMSDGQPPFKTLLGYATVRGPVRQGDAQGDGQLDRVQRSRAGARRQGQRDADRAT